MSDYKRMIAYIYAIKNGIKGRNVGFTKVDIHGGICKITVSLKIPQYLGDETFNVKLVAKNVNTNDKYIHIGWLRPTEDSTWFKTVVREEQIEGSNVNFSAITGLSVDGADETLFICEFANPVNESDNESETELGTGIETKIEEKSETKADTDELTQDNEENMIKVSDVDSRKQDLLEELEWSTISAKKQHLCDENDRECIEIMPEDLKLLPNVYEQIGNNSFLLHGYYNYKYIVLGRISDGNKSRFIVGVPGKYRRNEKTLAEMNGFDTFMQMENGEATGYYYKTLEM